LGAKQTYVVTGLLSSTTYYFAVKAYDERPNYSPLSNIANATTLASKDEIAPAAITDLSASAVSENSIKLTWSAPGDDGKSGTATGYDIRYATSKITDELWFEATKCYNSPRPQSAGTTESFKISSLFAGTKYYFAIRSFDERPNYSKLSNIPDATTYASEDDVPPNRITDLAVVETTQKTATLTWTAPGDDGNSGTATVYNIRYSTVPITAANWNNMQKIKETPAPKTAGEKETIIITGLTEATSYYFAIKAADERPNWSTVSNSPNGITSGTSKPELLVTLIPEKTIIYSGESINLIIEVLSSEQFQPVAAVEVTIISDNPDMIISPVVGHTDERGTFEVSITAPSVKIITIATISVEVIKPGYKYNKTELELTIQPPQIIPRFDLRIQKQDITFNQNIINDSDEIKIIVNITNLGPHNATEFIVKFSIDNITIGNEIHINELKINEYLQLTSNWTATFGEHNIRIEIIPMDYDMELNFTDNIAQRNFIVKGKESSEKINEDEPNQNSYFYIWSLISIIIIVFIFIMVLLFIIGKRQYDSYTYNNFIMPKEDIDENLPDEPLAYDDHTEDKSGANPEETIENDNDITESTETETKLDFEAETLETLEDTIEDTEDTSSEAFIIYEQ
jgi:chitodextrinase